MFWTVFFAVLLGLYVVGQLIAFGMIAFHWGDIEDPDSDDYKMAIFGILLSWFTVGICFGAYAEED